MIESDLGQSTVAALVGSLDALIEARRVECDGLGRSSAPLSLPTQEIAPTREQSMRRDLAERPVTAALELAVRTLGAQAFAAGLDLAALAKAACEANPPASPRYLAILNSRWHGIGHWVA